eukprot:10948872-Heterocapsa_arctica.AAC.1
MVPSSDPQEVPRSGTLRGRDGAPTPEEDPTGPAAAAGGAPPGPDATAASSLVGLVGVAWPVP